MNEEKGKRGGINSDTSEELGGKKERWKRK